ncbi:MAG: pyridoxal phosphate-dependent aminotransferase [Chitinophagaceae bacterium]|jgi:aspartate aminotransferase|nr:MAG: pyridoxal phosphate-dependent aminotransferase [Chitinophagaceae bacterium]
MELAQRLNRIAESQTLKMARLGRELRAKGLDIIDFSLGEPDFITPEHIREAAKKAIDEGYTHYTPVAGYAELRQAVCEKLKRDNHLDYKPEQIVSSTGAKHSLVNVIMSVVDPGDEVIIPTPYWVTYSEQVKFVQGKVVSVHGSRENKYKITAEQLEAAITPKTKLFMFSSPCNPSGSVYSKKELTALAEVFRKHPRIIILSDEIYEYINYAGGHESIAQFDFLKDRVVVVNGLSKGYAMTGWRLGYIAAPLPIAKACEKLQGQFTSGTCSITQRAGIVALTADLKPTEEMVKEFSKRRDFILKEIRQIKGIKVQDPDGAFYIFPDVRAFFGKSANGQKIENADDLCMYLLEKGLISTVTGSAFGEPDCIRISYATSIEKIGEGMQRLKKALEALQ